MKPQSNKISRNWYIVISLIIAVLLASEMYSQNPTIAVGFYNLENLFDTKDDSLTMDEEFTPTGIKNWTRDKYLDKLKNMAQVISALNKTKKNTPLALLGVSEIENQSVLEDLIQTGDLKNEYYKIIHYNSPDARGVDVALLYKPKYVTILSSNSINVPLFENDGTRKLTRDILLVKSKIGAQIVYILVNHWPSRRGGEQATREFRMIAAKTNKHLSDSIIQVDPNAAILIMGDLNDNPDNESLIKGLSTKSSLKEVNSKDFYNPFYKNYISGEGSTAYNDAWSLFDQIVLSKNLLFNSKPNSLKFIGHKIVRQNFMMEKFGHFKYYPKRTFSGDNYIGGYSDHFPVLCFFTFN